MTATAPPGNASDAEASTSRDFHRRRRAFGDYVAERVVELQEKYRARDRSAVAAMAHLRMAVSRPPGDDFAILWQTRVSKRHRGDHVGDDPTDTEQAMHTALTVYALHQQSIYDTPLHRDGPGLGAAFRLLSRAAPGPEAVRRRFAALGTATTYGAAVYHLRGMARLLRDHRIALDYGLLAEDLVRLQRRNGPAEVRARWGRDFYRYASSDTDSDTDRTDESAREE